MPDLVEQLREAAEWTALYAKLPTGAPDYEQLLTAAVDEIEWLGLELTEAEDAVSDARRTAAAHRESAMIARREVERLHGEELDVRTTWQFGNAKDMPHSFLPAHSLPVPPGTRVAIRRVDG